MEVYAHCVVGPALNGVICSVLYFCVLIGFTEAIWALTPRTGHSEYSRVNANVFADWILREHLYVQALIEMFQTTLSDPFLYEEVKEHGLVGWLAVIFWLVFTFLSAVVLMNQLIAMMGETYSKQRSQAAITWMLLRAGIIVESERSVMGKLVELWHRKKLPELRPKHHVKVCCTREALLLVSANAFGDFRA